MDWDYREISDFYDRVRSLLDNVESSTLSDSMIDRPEKAAMAERIIKRTIPSWETLKESDPSKFEVFESCVVYQTAIYFEEFVKTKQPKRIQTSSVNVEYSTSGNIKQTAETPLTDILQELLSILQETEEGRSFFGFRVTQG